MENDRILDAGISLPQKSSIENAKEIINLRKSYKEELRKVKNGRYAIIGLTVILAIGGIVETVNSDFDIYVVGINGVVIAALVGLYFYSLQQPNLAFILTIVFIVAVTALTAFDDPLNLIRGVLWKGVITYYLIVGLNPAKKINKTKALLQSYGVDLSST